MTLPLLVSTRIPGATPLMNDRPLRWRFLIGVALVVIALTFPASGQETLAISVNTNLLTVGLIPVGGVHDTWWDAPGTYSVTNIGTVAVRVMLSVDTSDPGGWQPGERVGENVFRLAFAPQDGAPKPTYRALSGEPLVLCQRLEPDEHVRFDLAFQAPDNADADPDPQTIRIAVSALAVE